MRKNEGLRTMSIEGCMLLAAEVLKDAYSSYVTALKTIKEYSDEYRIVEKRVNYINEYKDLNKNLNKIRNSIRRKTISVEKKKQFVAEIKELKKKIAEFEKNKDLLSLTKEEQRIRTLFTSSCLEKNNIEIFYKSKTFQIFTLREDIDPKVVIEMARKDADWVEERDALLMI